MLLTHFLIKFLFFSFQICKFAISLFPEMHHIFCQFFTPQSVLFYYFLRLNRFFTHFTLSSNCKLLSMVDWVSMVFLESSVGFRDISFRDLCPNSLNCVRLQLFSCPRTHSFQGLLPILKKVVDHRLVKLRLLGILVVIGVKRQREYTSTIQPNIWLLVWDVLSCSHWCCRMCNLIAWNECLIWLKLIRKRWDFRYINFVLWHL